MPGVPKDPAVRAARALKGSQAARKAYEARRLDRGAQYADKGMAYAAGYRTGYQVACAWYRRKLARAWALKVSA